MDVKYSKSVLEDAFSVKYLLLSIHCSHKPRGATRPEMVLPAALGYVAAIVQPHLETEKEDNNW